MPSPFPARCLVFTLEALPCFLTFIIAFIWIFFAPEAPTTTAAASALWMSPIIISTVLAAGFLIMHGGGCFPNCSLWKKSLFWQAVYDVVRSITCAGTICLATWYLWWVLVSSMFGELKPYDPHSEEKGSTLGDWFGTRAATLFLVMLDWFISAVSWIPASKDIKKLKEVRKTGNVDGYEVPAVRDDEDDQA